MACPQCFDIGWVLDCNDLTKPGPRCVEFVACFLPGCEHSGRPVEVVSFKGVQFRHVHRIPPRTDVVAAVSR